MPAMPIRGPAAGESVVGVEPQLLQHTDAGWRRRLNLFTGRALSENALDAEQQYRSGLLATLAQAVTPGTVNGLVLSMTADPDPLISVTAGYGIDAQGEDVSLYATLQTRLSTLAVIDAATNAPLTDPATLEPATFARYVASAAGAAAGAFVLQPVVAQVDETLVGDTTSPLEVGGTRDASCDVDPDTYAFEDLQIVDGARLVFVPWPTGDPALVLPSPAPAATYRNRVVYAVFDAEAALAPDEQLPWAGVGVPVALAAFTVPAAATWQPATAFTPGQTLVDPNGNLQRVQTAGTSGTVPPPVWNDTAGATTRDGTLVWQNGGLAWRAAFVDRSAVVRPGGVPRRRTVVPTESGAERAVQPALAQARIAQLGEQLADELARAPAFDDLAAVAAALPPSGVLPARALDFSASRNAWFPARWTVSAGPVHLEELESALETGMLSAALDTSADESVEVLVPLPDTLYDPDILVAATVAPDFRAELDAATQRRDAGLRLRKSVQLQLNVLETVLGPNAPRANPNLIDLDAGVTADEVSGRDALPASWPQPNANARLDATFGTLAPPAWRSRTTYAAGGLAIDTNGNLQRVVQAGTSGAAAPAWNANAGQTTSDGTVTWFNAGSGIWAPSTAYAAGELVVDANGNVQTVVTPGTSGASSFIWAPNSGAATADGTVRWVNAGPAAWQGAHGYARGQAVIDSNGNVQSVVNEGTSGATNPAWGDEKNETTPDGSVVWECLGPPSVWAPDSAYVLRSSFVDPNGNVQTVHGAGVSGDRQTIWNVARGATTADGGVTWRNDGSGTWAPDTAYAAGAFVIDTNGSLQTTAAGGTSGTTVPVWNAQAGGTTADGGITWVAQVWASADLQSLIATANAAPYTLTWTAWQPNTAYAAGQIVGDANGNLQSATTAGTSGGAQPKWNASGTTADGTVTWTLLAGRSARIPLIGDDDWNDLAAYGLQHFIDRLNAKVKTANDLIDLAFLTAQTDIYRFRQNVLGATDASRLATSPVLANIATGVTATATATDLKDYFATVIKPSGAAAAAAPAAAAPAAAPAAQPASSLLLARSLAVRAAPIIATPVSPLATERLTPTTTASVARSSLAAFAAAPGLVVHPVTAEPISAVRAAAFEQLPLHVPVVRESGVSPVAPQPTSQDVQSQSPMVGAQLDVRTLSVAERLSLPPSQESLFYAVGNRISLMQLLADLEITVDDIPFVIDAAVPSGTPPPNEPIPVETHTVLALRAAPVSAAVFGKLQNPIVRADTDEAGLFSTGVRVLEQHTQLLRALEGRVQTYVDFVGACTSALAAVQSDVARAQAALRGYETQVNDARQDVAFTQSLLADERARVDAVNAQRANVLRTAVELVAYTRPRTLETAEDVPSRQLVPGAIANPVPSCLQNPVAVPPELREIVALLREAPVSWLPSVRPLLANLGRPALLVELALATQARATTQLRMPLRTSSALLAPSAYGPAIAQVYAGNQTLMRGYQTARAQFAPASINALSWQGQLSVLAGITAAADIASSDAVHAEVAGAVAAAQQRISNVAACLYARANTALPAERLAWADYLRGPGLTVGLRSLGVLPNWNAQPYADRQQMQMLVDWLFAQIDGSNGAAAAFMSDVVRVCVLLASHAPVGDVIAGAVTVRTRPVIGGVVSLTLPSAKIASGMFVQLYSQGNLAAEAVVTDLDATTASATVTAVHGSPAFLEANDVAHFTTQQPYASALRAFAV